MRTITPVKEGCGRALPEQPTLSGAYPRSAFNRRTRLTTTATTAHASPTHESHAGRFSGKKSGRGVEGFHGNLFLYVQELASLSCGWAPFQLSSGGCRRFSEPVSQRLCIKTILWSERIDPAKVRPGAETTRFVAPEFSASLIFGGWVLSTQPIAARQPLRNCPCPYSKAPVLLAPGFF
jgi:hypothetical protein